MAINDSDKDVQALLQSLGATTNAEARPITLTFSSVSATTQDVGPVMVKTLPRAIINTFGYDQTRWLRQTLPSLFPRPKLRKERVILDNISAIVKPGEMLLVLGRPGSGCSTFLRTAANRSTLNLNGELRFAGIPHEKFRKEHRRDTIYLPEEDNHIPSLTVRQTLEFALRMSLPSDSRTGDVPVLATTLAKMFGLEDVMNTPVGGGPIPGISGGERKR